MDKLMFASLIIVALLGTSSDATLNEQCYELLTYDEAAFAIINKTIDQSRILFNPMDIESHETVRFIEDMDSTFPLVLAAEPTRSSSQIVILPENSLGFYQNNCISYFKINEMIRNFMILKISINVNLDYIPASKSNRKLKILIMKSHLNETSSEIIGHKIVRGPIGYTSIELKNGANLFSRENNYLLGIQVKITILDDITFPGNFLISRKKNLFCLSKSESLNSLTINYKSSANSRALTYKPNTFDANFLNDIVFVSPEYSFIIQPVPKMNRLLCAGVCHSTAFMLTQKTERIRKCCFSNQFQLHRTLFFYQRGEIKQIEKRYVIVNVC